MSDYSGYYGGYAGWYYTPEDFAGSNYGTESDGNYIDSSFQAEQVTAYTAETDAAEGAPVETVTVTASYTGETGADYALGAGMVAAFTEGGAALGAGFATAMEEGALLGEIAGPAGAVIGAVIGGATYWLIEHYVP